MPWCVSNKVIVGLCFHSLPYRVAVSLLDLEACFIHMLVSCQSLIPILLREEEDYYLVPDFYFDIGNNNRSALTLNLLFTLLEADVDAVLDSREA